MTSCLLQVLQQPSQAGILGVCPSATLDCQSLQTTFSTSAALSFCLVMLSVIICLNIAMGVDTWTPLALVVFQLSLWAMAATLTAAAWMLLPATHAKAVTCFMALMVAGGLWLLYRFLCAVVLMLWLGKGVSDTLHWTLQGPWGAYRLLQSRLPGARPSVLWC